jgi:Helix-hairpin-helix motif
MKVYVLIAAVAFSCACSAQTEEVSDSSDQMDPQMESVLTDETEGSEDSELVTLLNELSEHPLDINTATADELGQLPGLDGLIVSRILARRKQSRFRSVDGLKRIQGFSEAMLRMVSPYLTVRPRSPQRVSTVEVRSRLASTTTVVPGSDHFSGSPVRFYNSVHAFLPFDNDDGRRLSVNSNILTEKDPGERIGDFVSAYVGVDAAFLGGIVGDYSIESANGLLFPRKYAASVGANNFRASRFDTKIKGYASAEENFFLRGIALHAARPWGTAIVFVSGKPMNGTVDTSGVLTSLDRSGLFRTDTERRRKGNTRMTAAGGLVTLTGSRWNVGLEFFSSQLDRLPENRQRSLISAGIGLRILGSNWMMVGEAAVNRRGPGAIEGGVEVEPSPWLTVLLTGRACPGSFENIFRVSFDNRDEREVSASCDLHPASDVEFRCGVVHGFDQWNNSVSPFPVASTRYNAGMELRLSAVARALVELKGKQTSVKAASGGRDTELRCQQGFRVTVTVMPARNVQSQSRIELGSVHHERGDREKAILILQDFKWRTGRLSVTGRLALFGTGSYDSRLYEYENDVRGTFSTPALYGTGVRSYVLISLSVSKGILLGFKYSTTLSDGIAQQATASQGIQGDRTGSVTLQLDVRI